MGMYTQFHFGVELRNDVPRNVVDTLNYMCGIQEVMPKDIPNHKLFETSKWSIMLRCDSYYFDYKSTSLFEHDSISESFYFNVTSNFKNYDNEIELFLDWIKEYIKLGDDFLGYWRYEEDREPHLIYYSELMGK